MNTDWLDPIMEYHFGPMLGFNIPPAKEAIKTHLREVLEDETTTNPDYAPVLVARNLLRAELRKSLGL